MPETFTATIAPANVANGTTYTITGTVSFYDGTTLLGTAVINANTASLANVTLAPALLHTITAVYSGDTSWAASTSNAITLQSVLLPDVVTLEVNINTIGPGQLVTLVATGDAAPPAGGQYRAESDRQRDLLQRNHGHGHRGAHSRSQQYFQRHTDQRDIAGGRQRPDCLLRRRPLLRARDFESRHHRRAGFFDHAIAHQSADQSHHRQGFVGVGFVRRDGPGRI